MEGKNYDELLFGNALYHNLGQGKFEETDIEAGLETFWPWGIATGDYDNDGHEDVFITSGMGYPFLLLAQPADDEQRQRDRFASRGAAPRYRASCPGGVNQEKNIGGKPAARSSRSAVVADFDGDGPSRHIVTNNFNDRPLLLREPIFRRRTTWSFDSLERPAIGMRSARCFAFGQAKR